LSNYLARRKRSSEQDKLLLLLLLLGLGSLLVLTVIAVAAGAADIAAGDRTPIRTPPLGFVATSTSTDSPTPSKTPTETPTDTPVPVETSTPVPLMRIISFGVDSSGCSASIKWTVSGDPDGSIHLSRGLTEALEDRVELYAEDGSGTGGKLGVELTAEYTDSSASDQYTWVLELMDRDEDVIDEQSATTDVPCIF
jgi:hypothetical protein